VITERFHINTLAPSFGHASAGCKPNSSVVITVYGNTLLILLGTRTLLMQAKQLKVPGIIKEIAK
jgi:hypothetical protein